MWEASYHLSSIFQPTQLFSFSYSFLQGHDIRLLTRRLIVAYDLISGGPLTEMDLGSVSILMSLFLRNPYDEGSLQAGMTL